MFALLKGAGTIEAEELATERIRIDGGTQMRVGLNPKTVEEYKEAWLAGARFPALVVYFDGNDYWLGDGFHRLASHKEAYKEAATKPLIACEVRAGTRRDAVLHAVGANADHGLRRTDEDKQRAVDALLRDEEWGQWSDREIARRCNVSPTFVGKRRVALGGDEAEPATERTYVTRHGTVATMAVENIGGRQPLTVEEVKALILGSVPAEANAGRWLRIYSGMMYYRHLVPAGRDLQAKVFAVAMTNLLAETAAQEARRMAQTAPNGAESNGIDTRPLSIHANGATYEIEAVASATEAAGDGANRADGTDEVAATPVYSQAQIEDVIMTVLRQRCKGLDQMIANHRACKDPEWYMLAIGQRFTWDITGGVAVFMSAYLAVGRRLAAMPTEVTVHVDSEVTPMGMADVEVSDAGDGRFERLNASYDLLINGSAKQRTVAAKTVLNSIDVLLRSDLNAYSKLTGHHADVLPVRRGLEAMRDELTALITILQQPSEVSML